MNQEKGNSRNYLFDNIKGLLIFTVIWVHLCAANIKIFGYHDLEIVMMFICSFHMPLFMFITGYFSKHTSKQSINLLLINYLLISCMFFIYDIFFGSISFKQYTLWDFISPGFSMWYIFAVIILRLFFLDVKNVRKWEFTIFAFASILIMAAPMMGSIDIAITKTIANSIYFVLGFMCTEDSIQKLRRHNKLFFAVIIILIILIMFYLGFFVFDLKQVHMVRIMMLRGTNISKFDNPLIGYLCYLVIMVIAVIVSICIIGIFAAGAVMRNSLVGYVSILMLVLAHGWRNNTMMTYVEKAAFDGNGAE